MIDSVSEFFDTKDFAVPAVIHGRAINVIFDAQYVDVLGTESASPAATCASKDVADVQHDDQIEINGVTYRVTGIQPDGTGVTVLRLQLR